MGYCVLYMYSYSTYALQVQSSQQVFGVVERIAAFQFHLHKILFKKSSAVDEHVTPLKDPVFRIKAVLSPIL